ncbi:MAG: gamma-glutamyltransferase [Acidimicrobiales bacterium]
MAWSARGSSGAIAAGDPRASTLGMSAFAAGGNAIDAAIWAALAQWVVMPDMCGPGGDCFAIVASRDEVVSINGSGPAPAAGVAVHDGGPEGATVPGALEGISALHEQGALLPLSTGFEAAAEIAGRGFAISESLAWQLRRRASGTFGEEMEAMLGGSLGAGAMARWPALATSLRAIAEGGIEVFTRGELGALSVAEWAARGARLEPRDVSDSAALVGPPLGVTIDGWEVLTHPPVSQGAMTLLAMQILGVEGRDEVSTNSSRGVHLGVEAMKVAFVDASDSIYDGSRCRIEEMLGEKGVTGTRRRLPPLAQPGPEIVGGYGETTHLATADAEGRVVSLLHSLYLPLGARVASPSTGFLLNNRGLCFDAEGQNAAVAGRRPRHTLSNLMMRSPEGTTVGLGTPGANAQVQTLLQVALGIQRTAIDSWPSVLDAPRWGFWGGMDVALEDRVALRVMEDLVGRGHRLVSRESWDPLAGAVGVAATLPDSSVFAVQDRRRAGMSLAV